MKVELQAGDTITIPEGCKAVIKDGSVVIEREFEDGDILTSKSGFLRCPFIFKGYDDKRFYKFYAGLACGNTIAVCVGDDERWGNSDLSYATEEEKQLLFDKMKEQGLRWNAEEKKVEKIRGRAREFGEYYRIGLKGEVFLESDRRSPKDEVFYDTLNYFRTEEQAKEAGRRVKETLKKFHEEIGE